MCVSESIRCSTQKSYTIISRLSGRASLIHVFIWFHDSNKVSLNISFIVIGETQQLQGTSPASAPPTWPSTTSTGTTHTHLSYRSCQVFDCVRIKLIKWPEMFSCAFVSAVVCDVSSSRVWLHCRRSRWAELSHRRSYWGSRSVGPLLVEGSSARKNRTLSCQLHKSCLKLRLTWTKHANTQLHFIKIENIQRNVFIYISSLIIKISLWIFEMIRIYVWNVHTKWSSFKMFLFNKCHLYN